MFRFFERSASEERGGILLLGVFALAALLIVGALAIDAANLYHGRQSLQKAADMGALAAVGYTIQRGMANVETEAASEGMTLAQFIEAKAEEATLVNLAESGFPAPAASHPVTATYTPAPVSGGTQDIRFTVDVSVQRNWRFLLMHLVPMQILGLQPTATGTVLAASAQSKRATAYISLILDFSESMACPSAGPCTCLTPARTVPCPATGAKIDELIGAVRAFIKQFDYNNDVISVVPFAMSGRKDLGDTDIQAYTLEDLTTLYDATLAGGIAPASAPPDMADTDIDKIINQFRVVPGPQSSTNICDAMMRSYHAMSEFLAPGKHTAYVLFSDGAPTAGRLLLANPKPGMRGSDPYGLGAYDYSFFDINWRESGLDARGPSPLYQTNYLPLAYSIMSPPPLPPAGPGYAGCGPTDPLTVSPAAPAGSTGSVADVANRTLSPCLSGFGFRMPGKPTIYANDIAFSNWSQQFYNCAVQFSDFLREEQNMVHVVGLGQPDLDFSSPYQSASNPHLRKDIFNARIANDYIEGVVQSARDHGGAPWPEFGYEGYETYDTLDSRGASRQGEYLATPTASELTGLFEKIAKKILLALTA